MKYGILYISHMKILAFVFLRYREGLYNWNHLYFTNENLATTLSSGILCASQTYIKGIHFHNEIRNSLNFLYQNLGANPPSWK